MVRPTYRLNDVIWVEMLFLAAVLPRFRHLHDTGCHDQDRLQEKHCMVVDLHARNI